MARARRPRKGADPYRDYTFRVKLDGRLVAGVQQVSALKRTTEVVEYRQGGDPAGITRKMPGHTKHEPVTLERGITYDATFETWANQVAGIGAPPLNLRKEARIEVFDVDGELVFAYDIHRCWPSEYVALAGLEIGVPVRLIQSVTLQNEGWERDAAVKRRPRRRRPKPRRSDQ